MLEDKITNTQLIDQIPILPETRPAEPIVQCGVLYLGTLPTSSGLHGLDSIQEPLSHRYPVDGTNTIQGIDALLHVYENGIQLKYTRHPHATVFFPIAALVYSASVRFSIVDHDPSKPATIIDWRFVPLDALIQHESKHPPVFCFVVRRTQWLPGDECHCFITKSVDAAFMLVQAVTQAYKFARPNRMSFRSPVFYQLDHLGRRISETAGIVYISPANDDNSPMNPVSSHRAKGKLKIQDYLLNPTLGGFYYRTDANIIDKWQLWDDDDNGLVDSRPHPPASPFGLHEGLYHDDTTDEIERYLRHMEDEDVPCSCSDSSNTSCCSDTTSAEDFDDKYVPELKAEKSNDDKDKFMKELLTSCKSSFEPSLQRKKKKKTKKKKKNSTIIVEKVLPKPPTTIPILNAEFTADISNSSDFPQKSKVSPILESKLPSFSYTINERGEKITKEGNRIIFMDTVRPNTNGDLINSSRRPYLKSQSHSRHHSLNNVSTINVLTDPKLLDEKNTKDKQSPTTVMTTNDQAASDRLLDTNLMANPFIMEILNGYITNNFGYKISLKNQTAQSTSDRSESSNKKITEDKKSSSSSSYSSKHAARIRSQSISTSSQKIDSVKDPPSIVSMTSNNSSSLHRPKVLKPPSLKAEKVQEFVTNVYGTAQSIKSSISSRSNRTKMSLRDVPMITSPYISQIRYMQSNIYGTILNEYRNAY